MEAATTVERCTLRVTHPSGVTQDLVLEKEAVTIGRTAGNALVLLDTLSSRQHAQIDWNGEDYVITDRGSKNGTLVNGEKVSSHTLAGGDEIQIGDTKIRFDSGGLSTPEVDPMTEAGPISLEERDAIHADLESGLARFAMRLAQAEADLATLDDVAQGLLAVVACERATVILVEEGTQQPLVQFSRTSSEDPAAASPDDQVIQAALTTERPVCLRVPRAKEVLGATLGVRRHLLLLPLRSRERKLGLIALERDPEHAPFEDSDLELVAIAGGHVTTFLRMVL